MKESILRNKIYYHDTDAGGIVYYARYLEHLEEARSEMLADRGIVVSEYARKGVVFPVVHLEIDYKSPARYGDTIEIRTSVEKIGNASIQFHQNITRDGVTLIEAKTIWACVSLSMKPCRVPDEIRKALG